MKNITEDSKEEIHAKFAAAKKAQKNWAAISLSKRISCIQAFCDLLEKSRDRLANTLTQEMGKPLKESFNEINGARTRIQFFIEHSAQVLAPKTTKEDGTMTEVIKFEPLGVVANISAWNYPYLVGVNVFIPALIGGNAVLYKPSELTALTGLHIRDLLWEAGIPKEVFQVVLGEGSFAGKELLNLNCDGYFFTGSYGTGKLIAEAAAGKMVPIGLELGGKDPLYVADDVIDIAQVASAAVEGAFYNNGQSCCAVERIYVHEKIYEPFVAAFVNEVKKLKVGDPFDAATTQGSLAQSSHVAFLESQVKDALDKGAQLLLGGKKCARSGAFFEPTVLVNVNHRMALMKEETFGPLIGIQKVKDDDDAIALMNDTEFGLTAAVYSSNEDRAKNILEQINAGTCYWNCCDRVSPYLPWSGRKHSGLGATLSFLGIQAFVKPKGYHLRKN